MSQSLYRRSVWMVILGGICLSFLGIGDRSMDAASGPQIVLYRAVGQTIFFAIIFLFMKKVSVAHEFKSLSRYGWLIILLMALAGFLIVMSFQFTDVANAIFIVSLAPLAAALLGWVFLKERLTRRTATALLIAVIGVSVIFGTNMSGQGMIGMGLAFLMMLSYAGAIVTMRIVPNANVILLCALSGMLTLVLMLPLVDSFSISTKDLMICLGLGVFQVGLGTVLVLNGARHVPAAQVSILALLEVVLNPIWVWIFVNEVPSMTTLIGGSIVVVGVVYQALGSGKSAPT